MQPPYPQPRGSQLADLMPQRDISTLINEVREYRLPAIILPLAKDRTPFSDLSDSTIATLIARTLTCATRQGRFSDSIRRILNVKIPSLEDYTVIEAHIDLTGVTESLRTRLISLGFEPDNFAEIQPPQYIRHFTIQHRVGRESPQKSQLFAEVAQAATMAADVIDSCPSVSGYVETECYTTARILKLPPLGLNDLYLQEFPFDSSTFIHLKVARSDGELGTPGYDTLEKRAADIHVKLAPIATEEFGEPRLEWLLRDSGFYRIRSDAGNYMYSAHFSTLSDANMAYDYVASFARIAGGITGIMREVCTSLWRKTDLEAGVPRRAEVPPHLRLREGRVD